MPRFENSDLASAYTRIVRDVLDELMSIWRSGGTAGLATVVRTIRSAPRSPGAAMVVAPDGSVTGSVSGGCVEAAVYELATEVMQSGRPALQRYGISSDDAFAVGLTCGGEIDIFAEPVSQETFPQLQAVADAIAAHRPIAVATVVAHPDPQWVGRQAGGRTRRRRRVAGLGPRRRCGHRRRPRPAVRRAQRGPHLRPGRAAAGRGNGGFRGQPRAASADADIRCDRLRRGARPAGRLPRLPGHRLRRQAGLRHPGTVSRGRRGRRRLARPVPRRAGPAGRCRRPHRDLRAHPRPQVRRAGAAGRAAAPRGRLHRRDGLAADP